ncbi:helix-turn-helix domain-containing protein [Maritalea porphyrae]|uniref:helix-turn-helix domain-containing protein n=1 Tax=Maritalea porphyrae TaxID=880732 RepID=UPI0022AF304D|nr:AraC family transcriptional regulator [Maritalea porphyrae]MCZ4274138.1 AraC family transcriptional regulator [Maritalea porphyrae]
MSQTQTLVVLLATMTMSVSMLGTLYCLTQDRNKLIFRVLALVLFVSALIEMGVVLTSFHMPATVKLVIDSTWVVGASCVSPLFWLYVWVLTAEDQKLPKNLPWHFVVPAAYAGAVLVTHIFSVDSISFAQNLFDDRDLRTHQFNGLVFLPIPLQWACYLIATSHRLMRYRLRLKDYFASTVQKEMQWISFVIAFYALYWLSQAAPILFGLPKAQDGALLLIAYILNIILVTTIVLWGLRQRPEIFDGSQPEKLVARYAKSALDPVTTQKIAVKLRAAMTTEKLYLNANLSLWTLARHVRMSDNYVSQVLNEQIGENFFDFVNGYRIEAAKLRLQQGNENILTITYEVGFNSRSSFYTAFRKVTGTTPTAFRKLASFESDQAGTDD